MEGNSLIDHRAERGFVKYSFLRNLKANHPLPDTNKNKMSTVSNGGPANLPQGPSASRAISDCAYSALMRSGQPLRGTDRTTLVSNEHHIRRHTDEPCSFVSFTRCLSVDKEVLGNNEQKKHSQ